MCVMWCTKLFPLVTDLIWDVHWKIIWWVIRGSIDIVGCTTNVYKLDAYAGAPGFYPEFRQYASRVSGPCGLTVVYKMSLPFNLTSLDIACTEWYRQ